MLDPAYLDAIERGIVPGSRQTFSEEEMRKLVAIIREQGRQIAEYEDLREVVADALSLHPAARPAKVLAAFRSRPVIRPVRGASGSGYDGTIGSMWGMEVGTDDPR
jgi:hypothetical protein